MIHPLSIVDDGAEIGEGTNIWHFCHITDTAIIGKNCTIGQGCYIAGIIFEGCKIQNNVSVFEEVTLHSNVFIGPHTTFTNVKRPRAYKIGRRKFTAVGGRASIGAGCVILPGITIGHHALIGAGSVVTKNVPAYAIVYGNPARIKGDTRNE